MWGDDFAHKSAKTFDNMDAMLAGISDFIAEDVSLQGRYDIQYSTVSQFFESVRADAEELGVEWTVEKGDFWQYNLGSNYSAYWTGYFSTYPELKKKIASFSNFIEASQ